VQITPTQIDDNYDFELDSMASQSMLPTRKWLQEKWRIISVKEKTETAHADMRKWIEDHARTEMGKAGIYEDLPPGKGEPIGWFKRAHVRLYSCSQFHAVHLLTSIIVYSIATPCQKG
jgi:hypothetical protein